MSTLVLILFLLVECGLLQLGVDAHEAGLQTVDLGREVAERRIKELRRFLEQ
jgi:hypothetical protein